jgi:hypothetical protein
MPNLKIFVDESLGAEASERLHAALPSLRELMCRQLGVDIPLAQFVLVPVLGLGDQAQLAVEMQILPKPDRTREHLVSTCEALRDALRAVADVKTAIRVTTVDPANYLVMR